MSGTFDPAAMDAKLDRILGQLTTMNNRLNSHDARLARVETGKPAAGKGLGGDDSRDDEDSHYDSRDDHRARKDNYDGGDDARDRAWAEFHERAIRDRRCLLAGRHDSGRYDRNGG